MTEREGGGQRSHLLLFVSGPLGGLGTGGGLVVGAVDELEQVLHPAVVLHAHVPLRHRGGLLPLGLLLLPPGQAQPQLLAHLRVVTASGGGRGLERVRDKHRL